MQIDAKAFALGNALRAYLAGRGAKKLVGYLYGHVAKEGETPTHTINGVNYVGAELPFLPEVDESYKYWYMNSASWIYMLNNPLWIGNGSLSGKGADASGPVYYYDDGEWVYYKNMTFNRYPYSSVDGGTSLSAYQSCWANYDITRYSDGSVWLAEEDCVRIPIYE